MLSALTLKDIESIVKRRYDHGEKRIVGIMLARYDIKAVQHIMDESLLYWDYKTNRAFDIFWCAYGEYAVPKGTIAVKGIDHFAHFDISKFISCVKELDDLVAGSYNDHIQLLLVNYYDGRLHYNESVRIDLEKNFGVDSSDAREYMNWLLTKCESQNDIKSLLLRLGAEEIKLRLKGITPSDIIEMIGLFR